MLIDNFVSNMLVDAGGYLILIIISRFGVSRVVLGLELGNLSIASVGVVRRDWGNWLRYIVGDSLVSFNLKLLFVTCQLFYRHNI